MKYKGIALVGVVLTGGLMLLAYHAGANTNRLSAEDTNFNHLLADHHNRSLTQIMRDGAVDKVGKWIENHERRLVALAAEGVSGYSALSSDQINFNKYKSTAHGNKLTQEMRDGMTAMLTNVATNHEMRLRAFEKPTANKTPKPNDGGVCVGEYQQGTRLVSKPVDRTIACYCGDGSYDFSRYTKVADSVCNGTIVRGSFESDGSWNTGYINNRTRTLSYQNNKSCEWFNYQENINRLYPLAYTHTYTSDNGFFPLDRVEYDCSSFDERYCERTPNTTSCSELSKVACNQQSGCTWKENNNTSVPVKKSSDSEMRAYSCAVRNDIENPKKEVCVYQGISARTYYPEIKTERDCLIKLCRTGNSNCLTSPLDKYGAGPMWNTIENFCPIQGGRAGDKQDAHLYCLPEFCDINWVS